MEKDILTLTASEYISLIDTEEARLLSHRDSNTPKALQKLRLLAQLLNSVPTTLELTVEGCRNDSERGFQFGNAGSITECIVKWHKHHTDSVCKAWDVTAPDGFMGCIPFEVKASLAPNCKATPYTTHRFVYLVNRLGAWRIKASEVTQYLDAKGRLPDKAPCGIYDEVLSLALGFDGEEA